MDVAQPSDVNWVPMPSDEDAGVGFDGSLDGPVGD